MNISGEILGHCDNCKKLRPAFILIKGFIKAICCRKPKIISIYDKKTNN